MTRTPMWRRFSRSGAGMSKPTSRRRSTSILRPAPRSSSIAAGRLTPLPRPDRHRRCRAPDRVRHRRRPGWGRCPEPMDRHLPLRHSRAGCDHDRLSGDHSDADGAAGHPGAGVANRTNGCGNGLSQRVNCAADRAAVTRDLSAAFVASAQRTAISLIWHSRTTGLWSTCATSLSVQLRAAARQCATGWTLHCMTSDDL